MAAPLLRVNDSARRGQGRMLDRMGLGAWRTPSRTLLRRRELELLAYQSPDRERPAIVLVPAPIKAAYIWDLTPGASVVQRCLAAGLQVYLAAWRRPRRRDGELGLDEYVDHALHACVDAIATETARPRVVMAGHSLGGTFAAIFASLYPRRVSALVELEGPMAFGSGCIEAALAEPRPRDVASRLPGNVPGTFLNTASAYADPTTFYAEPWLDWLQSMPSPSASRLCWAVRRWTLDEAPMARRLFEEIKQGLYRENRFAEDRLHVGGRLASPRAINAPVLAVFDSRSRIVPRESVEAYRNHTGSSDVRLIEYHGDRGVLLQHVGVLVGPSAHAELWPQIMSWVQSHAAAER